ncbi:Crp/Fnr family transcriptional regulator [Morganella morganii]|uniref:Crp/Fnr family transcriptional regulator n=1 Tax=Morganella morganii TaxID=582 RepID=UPI001646AB93|nr:Crp/Fnr family transcriptional regulator [Morganella morganii]MBC3995015.1 Crp/Fnr family transcriptional regulator [Morganella morganii]
MTFVKKTLAPAQQMAILRSCPLFQAAADDDLALVLADSTHRQFAAGELISREGETVKACPLMISGQIDVFRHTWSGEEKVFGMFTAGELVAIAAVFMPHNRFPMSLRARTDSSALMLDKQAILRLCHACPAIMAQLLARFSLKLYENINHIDWLTSSSAEQRLAAYLLDLKRCQQSDCVVLPLSRGQLAAKLGVRYETLSRLFSGWRQKAFIGIDKDAVRITNESYLAELAIPAQRPF